jgi:hypothetical protein
LHEAAPIRALAGDRWLLLGTDGNTLQAKGTDSDGSFEYTLTRVSDRGDRGLAGLDA